MIVCATAALLAGATTPVAAHPHVWVSVKTTVLYENGAVTGLRHVWTFDEFYTSMALQGLDANNDGVYDRSELAELAKVNIEGLGEFGYFTTVTLGGQPLKLKPPVDYWLEHAPGASPPGPTAEPAPQPAPADAAAKPASKGFWDRLVGWILGNENAQQAGQASAPATPPAEPTKVLSLVMTLPLEQPVLAEAQGLALAVTDSTFFIWFEFAKDNPVAVSAGAPAGCAVELASAERDAMDIQRLGEAINKELGGGLPPPMPGLATGKIAKVGCKAP